MKYILFVLLSSAALLAQSLYQGPAQGTVTGGVAISTTDFIKAQVTMPKEKIGRNKMTPKFSEQPAWGSMPYRAEDIYANDNSHSYTEDTSATVLMQNFEGMLQTNSIPPDPNVAVGPQHIVATVNSEFGIFDKSGNKLQVISGVNWYKRVNYLVDPFDPKVVYDHYAKRWIMVWLDQDDASKRGYMLVSISDDSIPLGTWYNWALPSNVNGTTFDNSWSDYQGVGFDDKALYITGDQFSFDGNFLYTKIRVIPIAQLLLNNAGAVTYTDFWDIRDPQNINNAVFNIRPSISFTPSANYPLLHSPYGGGNFVILYQLANVLTTPTLTAKRVTTSSYQYPPTPQQLGGGSMAFESSSPGLCNEPVLRDGRLWGVHTVRNPVYTSYSAVHYFGIDISTNLLVNEGMWGASGSYYMYPSLMMDKNNNMCLTYSRTGPAEYAGAFFATRKSTDPAGLKGSYVLQTGRANYVKDYGGGRNRWGDYMGIALDPADPETFWMLTEFVSSKDTWSTWIGAARTVPLSGAVPFVVTKEINYQNVEVGFQSPVQEALISNFGIVSYTIDSVQYRKDIFKLQNQMSFPFAVNTYDTVHFKFKFVPMVSGKIVDTMRVYSAGNIVARIILRGRGFIILPSVENILYGISGGNVIRINKTTASAVSFDPSNYSSMNDLAIDPITHTMYGLINIPFGGAEIVRVNAQGGDAYTMLSITNLSLVTMAFDTLGNLYTATRSGLIYRLNLTTGNTSFVDSVKINLSAITFNPKTNEMWATNYKPIGAGRDLVLKPKLTNGEYRAIGNTGFGVWTTGIAFDEYGNLFGVKSGGSAYDLIKIDTASGAGTMIAATGFGSISGLEYLSGIPLAVRDEFNSTEMQYSLAQNYPNPFNPTTVINYTIPFSGSVTMKVYDAIGTEVATLVNSHQEAGSYNVTFDASKLNSGVYFYTLKSGEYISTKKLMFLK